MVDVQTISTVAKFCVCNLDLGKAELGSEYYKASMPLCVVDAVFSIGVRYESVKNTLERLCGYYDIQHVAKDKRTVPGTDEQISTTDFLKLFGDKTPRQLADEVYQNRQRTSARNGILKAEAVVRFLEVLKDFNAEYFQDIPRLVNNDRFASCIQAIHGQGSGISLKYFFMLAGIHDFIKPDRMIIRFLLRATGQKFNLDQCQSILYGVTSELNKQGHNLTPMLLDNIIWNYARTMSQEKPQLPSSDVAHLDMKHSAIEDRDLTISELKTRLIDKIQKTDDKNFLKKAFKLLQIGSEEMEFHKLSEDQKNAVYEARQQIKDGQFLTEVEANKDIDEWLNK